MAWKIMENNKNWYKIAKNFEERNFLNHEIDSLTSIQNIIRKASKIIIQNASMSKRIINTILNEKILSSFPSIKKVLSDAESVALDSPLKFQVFCQNSMDEIENILSELKDKRDKETFGDEDKLKTKKGWI